MDLKGKAALITGGTRMGETIARALGARGAQIILTWRSSQAAADKSVKALQAAGITASAFQCDLSKTDSIQNLIQSIEKQYKRLDILIHMASNYEKTPLATSDLAAAWDAHLDVDAKSAYVLIGAAAPLMRKGKQARVILMSDWLPASERPRYNDHSAYYIAKAAAKAVVESLALELAPEILINAIAPGPILAPSNLSPEEYKEVEKATPLGRWGGAEEIAKAVLFLVETDFVTGETLRVDGGRHLV